MGSDELVARLRAHLRFVKLPAWVRHDLPLAANEIERLTAQLAEARESERAAVVAWLNAHPDAPVGDYARGFAFAIKAGEHLK